MNATTTTDANYAPRQSRKGVVYGTGFRSRHYTIGELVANVAYHLGDDAKLYDHDALVIAFIREVGLFPIGGAYTAWFKILTQVAYSRERAQVTIAELMDAIASRLGGASGIDRDALAADIIRQAPTLVVADIDTATWDRLVLACTA